MGSSGTSHGISHAGKYLRALQRLGRRRGALVAAVTAAVASGGGTIHLAPGCTYTLTAVNNTSPNPILASNGLPVITVPITINGWNTTIARDATAPQFAFLR